MPLHCWLHGLLLPVWTAGLQFNLVEQSVSSFSSMVHCSQLDSSACVTAQHTVPLDMLAQPAGTAPLYPVVAA